MEKLSKVLIIEDDPTTSYLHKRLLQGFEVAHQIEIANDGEEAIQLIKQYIDSENEDKIPQLIFVDLDMPFMDGFQFLEAFKKLNFRKERNAPVVLAVLTSSISRQDMRRARDSSVNAYIIKPLTKEKIMELMEEQFGWKKNVNLKA